LTGEGDPVIADFGLSRVIAQPLREYTNEVMTLHYRPPELVFGEKKYSIGVDLWAVGCIFVELFVGEPLFRAKCELELLFKFCQILGTPTIENFPNLKEYYDSPDSKTGPPIRLPKNIEGLRLNEILAGCDSKALDLVNKLLVFDPNKRITAKEALKHPFLVTKATN
jgi:serine/threonine protein kinase